MWDDDVDREEYERLTYDYESLGYYSSPSKKKYSNRKFEDEDEMYESTFSYDDSAKDNYID